MSERMSWPSRPPGPELAADLAAVDPSALSDDELIDVMAAWRRQASWAQAGELAAVAELARRREHGSPENADFTSAEVGLALTMSPRSADAHVAFAQALAERLPLTRQALADGRIDVLKARVIDQGTAAVDDDVAAEVERRVLPAAPRQTPSRLRARVERAVIAVDPAGAERCRRAAEAARRVDCYDTGNGTAVLSGVHLPAGPAIAADNRLRAIARAMKADGDPRTLDQLSADVFVSLLLGVQAIPGAVPENGSGRARGRGERPDAKGASDAPGGGTGTTAVTGRDDRPDSRPGASSATDVHRAIGQRIGTVHLTVPLLTLLGLSDEPGEVAGYGPLVAEVARQMAGAASDPKTRWCVTVTGPDGEPVHHGHPGYRPPAAMAHTVRTLQPTCSFPGCDRPAWACDLDHRIPYDQGGVTCPCNLNPLCRRHHRAKQAKGWQFAECEGLPAWTTPAGKTYVADPDPPGGDRRPGTVPYRSSGPSRPSRLAGRSIVEAMWRCRVLDPPYSHASAYRQAG